MAGTIYRHITWATAAFWASAVPPFGASAAHSQPMTVLTRLLHNKQPGDIHQIHIEHASNIWPLTRNEHKWSLEQQNLTALQSEIDDLASLLVHTQVQSVLQPEAFG